MCQGKGQILCETIELISIGRHLFHGTSNTQRLHPRPRPRAVSLYIRVVGAEAAKDPDQISLRVDD